MSGSGTPAVALPVTLPGTEGLPWLAPAVAAVLERVGGSTYRLAGDGVAALVTARAATEFDVVLEVTAGTLTLRVWGLERRYPLPAGDLDAASGAALRALDDWMALLSGAAQLVVYYRAGTAHCWTVTDPAHAVHADRGWHPRTPPPRLIRWLRRWRRRVLANRLVEADAVRVLRDRTALAAAGHAQERRAHAAPAARGGRAPVVAA